jgi:hypothetical protein
VNSSRAAAPVADPVFKSTALARFLAAVGAQPAAELVDLGPVIGSNISFLGERVGCKIHIEDLYADLDRHAQQETLGEFAESLDGRFRPGDQTITGVLCWDVFDYLEAAARTALAAALTRMLRPGGALLAFFSAVPDTEAGYTKYVIEDGERIRARPSAAAGGRRRQVLQNREILKLFEPLRVSESVLLKCQLREVLFLKP